MKLVELGEIYKIVLNEDATAAGADWYVAYVNISTSKDQVSTCDAREVSYQCDSSDFRISCRKTLEEYHKFYEVYIIVIS